VFLKRTITWYYSRKIKRDEIRLIKLKDEKKKLLDEVMDKETYKNAKEILEKFAPEQLQKESAVSV
jgi:NADH:ubiquinone oxidoreductase subunit F (NADH-binding)